MVDRPIQITLGEDEFRALARGSLLIRTPDGPLLLTTSIGPFRMLGAMADEIDKKGQRAIDPPEAREFLPAKRLKR